MQSFNLSLAIFIICTVLFFFLFIRVDCGGMKIIKITGTELAFGLEEKTMKEFFETRKEKTGPMPFAALAFLLSIIGVVVNLLKTKFSTFISAISSILLIMLLLALKSEIDEIFYNQGSGELIEYEWPFWAIIVLSAFNFILSLIQVKNSDSQLSQEDLQEGDEE